MILIYKRLRGRCIYRPRKKLIYYVAYLKSLLIKVEECPGQNIKNENTKESRIT